MATYSLPNNATIEEIEQEVIPQLTEGDPLFEIIPIQSEDAATVKWEQKDNYTGLMNVRGINGQPGRVKRVGSNLYEMEPGYFGDFQDIDEKELTKRRQLGTFGDPVDIDDLVQSALEHLFVRQINRQRKMIADVLTTGTFSVVGENGATMATDTFNVRTFSASVAWGTPATSTPLRDVRNARLTALGYSYEFDKDSIMLMNEYTYNKMLFNTNSADLAGKRDNYGATFNNIASVNKLLEAENLPQLAIYNESYLDESSGLPSLFVPNDKVVMIGRRKTGKQLGSFAITRNAQNPDVGAKPYTWFIDPFMMSQGNVLPAGAVPRTIQVHRGFNGGIKLPYAGGIIVMSV